MNQNDYYAQMKNLQAAALSRQSHGLGGLANILGSDILGQYSYATQIIKKDEMQEDLDLWLTDWDK